MRFFITFFAAIFITASVTATAEDNAVTIYSSAQPGAIPPEMYRPGPHGSQNWHQIPGYATVRHLKNMSLEQGRQRVRFRGVAELIDPTTVQFESLTDPEGTSVIEQNFEFDLVNTQKLLERYIDQKITVEQIRGDSVETVTGTLLGTQGGMILRTDDGQILTLNNWANISFPELPGGLITRPTLVWELTAAQGGQHETRVSYQTQGMTWWADYNATFSEASGCQLDLSAWVSIINKSGASYPNARLKLIAGDVNRVQQPQQNHYLARESMAMADGQAKGFEEKSFFEYHLYTLGRPTSLPENSTKQVELFPSLSAVDCEKELVFDSWPGNIYYGSPRTDRGYGRTSQPDVAVFLRLKNSEENQMGMPLPAGRVRINQLDPADDTLEFVGEDVIDHTPRNEEILLKVGNAFDVVGERTQTNFTLNSDANWLEETVEVEIRNRKEESQKVIVREKMYRWSGWEITKSSHDYEKINATSVHFELDLAADESETITYTVRYTW